MTVNAILVLSVGYGIVTLGLCSTVFIIAQNALECLKD